MGDLEFHAGYAAAIEGLLGAEVSDEFRNGHSRAVADLIGAAVGDGFRTGYIAARGEAAEGEDMSGQIWHFYTAYKTGIGEGYRLARAVGKIDVVAAVEGQPTVLRINYTEEQEIPMFWTGGGLGDKIFPWTEKIEDAAVFPNRLSAELVLEDVRGLLLPYLRPLLKPVLATVV